MVKRNKKIARLIAGILILLAFFQLLWPYIYNSPLITSLNPYPTQEYLQIMWLFSPNGLSTITILTGVIAIAWVAFTNP
ncbi:MAG: hypothetical protein LUQ32_06595 [Methanomicrobiales archaeon]|nr:hypothetical protein [Methanomicrobiales archaeon]